jgi:hypothetical protein
MRMRGVEPPRAEAHRHLKPARLPIPPHPQGFLFTHFPDNNFPSDTNNNGSFRFVKNFSVNPVRNSMTGKKYDTKREKFPEKHGEGPRFAGMTVGCRMLPTAFHL